MKKLLLVVVAILLVLSLAACTVTDKPSISAVMVTPQASSASTPTPSETTSAPTPTPTLTTSSAPTPTPTPTPTQTVSDSGDTPDHAGSGNVLFDIYKSSAEVDLNKDGTPEQLEFTQGSTKSTLGINGTSYTINHPDLAQLFAVTDIDTSDSYLELVFTDKYNSDLADGEIPSSYLYWWNGTSLKEMGSLLSVKFDGSWRSGFDASLTFKGNGEVYCLARTTQLTDVWYLEQLKASGGGRKLQEVLYPTKPVIATAPLTIKTGKACLLLAHGDSKFFGSSYNSMWDYASWPHSLGRAKNPNSDIVIIAQGGETLKIVGVLGPNWLKLQTSDGYKGWIKVVDGNVQGYYKVMHLTGADIFDGIVIAG